MLCASKINKASMVFSVTHHSGSLFDSLAILSEYGLNMKKLESRPIEGKPWEYSFFVETELNDQEKFDKACKKMSETCTSFRVLGKFTSTN